MTPGARLGPYELLSPIGAGGMGEVYKARDTRLDRVVAIKASKENFSERFEREARVIAALNHPNICTLHDVGPNYLVMEFVEGETLAARIAGGAIPAEEALGLARQIAAALEAAHEKGVVHRDLKPGNVMLKPDGSVKVLDFGLAKMSQPEARASGEDSPTLSIHATQAGVILGTAAYMSPEQARGKVVDKRSDIWAFGVVLYEMLTGQRLFHGEDLTEILASVVKDDPNLDAVPAQVRPLLKLCLAKDPAKRLRDIGDAMPLIDVKAAGPSSTTPLMTRWLPWVVAAALAVTAALGWMRSASPGDSAPRQLGLAIVPDAKGIAPVGGLRATPTISPDGSAVIYYGSSGPVLRRLSQFDTQPVQATGIVNQGFWARDSRTFLFGDGSSLKRMSVPEGAVETAADQIPGPMLGGDASAAGNVLVAAVTSGVQLYWAPAAGGKLERINIPGLLTNSWPEFLNASEDFIFFSSDAEGGSAIYLATLRDGRAENPVRLMSSESAAHYTPAGGGHLLFVRNDNLYAHKLNREARRLEGEPRLIERGVASGPNFYVSHFSVSAGGAIAWRPGGVHLSQVTIFDRSGNRVGTAGPPAIISSVRLSPDESRVLGAHISAWILEPNRPGQLQIEQGTYNTLWKGDGSTLLSLIPGTQGPRLVERPANSGSGGFRDLPVPAGLGRLLDLSPDGTTLLFSRGAGYTSVMLTRLDGASAEPTPVIEGNDQILGARLAPDGRWVVFESQRGGIYVQPATGSGIRRQVASGRRPVWRSDGKEIVYIDTNQSRDYVWSVPVTVAADEVRPGTPSPLFPIQVPASAIGDLNFMAVSRDGSRFYIAQAVDQPNSGVINIRLGAIQ